MAKALKIPIPCINTKGRHISGDSHGRRCRFKNLPILIYDIVPVLTIKDQSTEIVEFNNTMMTFNLELPNPENLKVKYVWTFPEGTVDANGNAVTTFTGYSDEQGNIEYPEAVKFKTSARRKFRLPHGLTSTAKTAVSKTPILTYK